MRLRRMIPASSAKTVSAKISEFREDDLQHVKVLTEKAGELGIDAPTEGDMKEMLTTGKIALANKAHEDELRHRKWTESTADTL